MDVVGIEALSLAARSDKYHVKAIKPCPAANSMKRFPCWTASPLPARAAAPSTRTFRSISSCALEGRVRLRPAAHHREEPPPFITGTICAHNCMTKCMRNYYDEPVNIRATKLVAAEKGYDAYMSKITPPAPVTDGRKVAVIGRRPHRHVRGVLRGPAGTP